MLNEALLPGDPCPGFTAESGRCWRMGVRPEPSSDPSHGAAALDGAVVLAEGRPDLEVWKSRSTSSHLGPC